MDSNQSARESTGRDSSSKQPLSPDVARPLVPDEAGDLRLSYKFQRLRERLRSAIKSGEFTGKLPGERQLARRFRVNAKTLSKALTDLAAEGVLERSIGRGTFVRAPASAPGAATPSLDRWLIICDERSAGSPVIRRLCAINPGAQVVHDLSLLRPSFLNSFKAVIDFDPHTSIAFLRDLVVRSMSVLLVGREPTNYSMNAVLVDRTLGASLLARDLMLAGHRRFLAIERRGCTQVSDAIRRAAQRYAPDASVDVGFPSEAATGVEQGATAVICDDTDSAVLACQSIAALGFGFPARVSIAAVGATEGEPPCTGYYVSAVQKADAIVLMLADGNSRRPNTVWLTGTYIDKGTAGPAESMIDPTVRVHGYEAVSLQPGDARS